MPDSITLSEMDSSVSTQGDISAKHNTDAVDKQAMQTKTMMASPQETLVDSNQQEISNLTGISGKRKVPNLATYSNMERELYRETQKSNNKLVSGVFFLLVICGLASYLFTVWRKHSRFPNIEK